MGTISNGVTTKPYENLNALGLDWKKSSRTDLDPILKDCVIVAATPDAMDHPHPSIPDGTHMVALSDDKDLNSPVLYYSRAEIRKFAEGIKADEFDDLMATDEEWSRPPRSWLSDHGHKPGRRGTQVHPALRGTPCRECQGWQTILLINQGVVIVSCED